MKPNIFLFAVYVFLQAHSKRIPQQMCI